MHIARFLPGHSFLLASAALLSGCTATPLSGAATASQSLNEGNPVLIAPDPGSSVRVGGALEAAVTGSDGNYRSGACTIDTPLPAGFPMPTPPEAIDLKTYPRVRLAEVAGAGDPVAGMSDTFWPLFNHIKRHDIAMTSPVEVNYQGMRDSAQSAPESWSMAFLYRRPELNQTGVEGQVVVRDAEPVTVVAVGMKGDYAMSLVQRGMRDIEAWLAANPHWEPAGNWRALYYNGPTLLWWNKWAEVQLPLRRSQTHQTAQPSDESIGTPR